MRKSQRDILEPDALFTALISKFVYQHGNIPRNLDDFLWRRFYLSVVVRSLS